jgi:hypothetical protein
LREFRDSKQKSRDGFLRAGFAIFAMMALLPVIARHAQPFPSDQQIAEKLTKRFRQIETTLADNVETEKPAAVSSAGSTISAMMPMCP